jgi:hypothetical protein
MNAMSLVLGILCIVAGLFFLRAGARGAPAILRALRRTARPIAKLDLGEVEVAGVVTAVGEPLLTLTGQPVVALRTVVEGFSGWGNNRRSTGVRQDESAVPAFVEDASGKCRLDLEQRAIVGETRQARLIDVRLVDATPAVMALVPDGSTRLTIRQTFIPVGAKVLVTGFAGQPRAQADGYRDGALEWTLSGTTDDLLVISVGSLPWFFARAVAPVLGLAFVSLYLVALGGLILAFLQS